MTAPPPSPSSAKCPPCDQCRRRKVKCDAASPCDRCIQSDLRCTREIIRKRRGPKKGSGSVIARLRDETDVPMLRGGLAPPLDLPPLELRRHGPSLSRSASGDRMHGASGAAHSGDGVGPTSAPYHVDVRSVTHSLSPNTSTPDMDSAILHHQTPPTRSDTTPLDSPLLGRFADFQAPIQYPSPGSSGFLTINELAHRIFDAESYAPMTYPVGDSNQPTADGQMAILAPNVRPTSINAIISSAAGASNSPSNHSPHSPAGSYDGQAFLYRTTSGSLQVESRVAALAAEIGMSANLISQCVKHFFLHIYPILPIIHEATFRRRLNRQEDLLSDEKCQLLSLCALTILQAAPVADLNLEAKKDKARQFLAHFHEVRKTAEWIESASLATIISSLFVGITYFELKQPRSHQFYLREATGLALELGLHQESFYVGISHMQEICNRRTFAVLFVTERGAAILRNKSVQISKLPSLPDDHFDDEDPSILAGFQCLCRLFALLDEKFVELWRDPYPEESTLTRPFENIAEIQQSLNEMSFETQGLADIQKADVLITQQWLRLVFWQASMRQGLVSSSSAIPAFSYDFPLTIAKTLCQMMSTLPMQAVLVHGLGIFEKVFEVAYTLMDALTISKIPWSESEELRYLFGCLSASPNSHSTYVRMLETKMDGQKTKLHSLQPGHKILQSPELSRWENARRQGPSGQRGSGSNMNT